MLLVIVGAILSVTPAFAQEQKPVLRWYGQSFFQLVTTRGTRVVFDPHQIEGYGRPVVAADLVLVSHMHLDHTAVDRLENRAKAKILYGLTGTMPRKQEWMPIDETFRDVKVFAVGTYHDRAMGIERGKNTVFVVEADGMRFVHLGDLGHELSDAQLKAIGKPDVLMIPIGGIYTLNGTLAKKVVAQLQPAKWVLPMHYGTKAFDELLPPDEFLDEQEHVEKRPATNELELDPSAKPAHATVLLLGWKKGE
jgi:L-ascorbate metabolism protein UlaG (beta-lactamase superfamily)